jgi:hypothetical protein
VLNDIFSNISAISYHKYAKCTLKEHFLCLDRLFFKGKLAKGPGGSMTRLAAASDKAYQLLAHGRWFSPGTLASSTTKTGHHFLLFVIMKDQIKTTSENCSYEHVCVLPVL